MTNEEIQKIRDNYNQIILDKSKLEETKLKILELEQKPEVKEYIDLIKLVSNLSDTNFDGMIESITTYIAANTLKSNDILFDYGYQSVVICENHDPQGNGYDEDELWHVYQDLETGKFYRYVNNTFEECPSLNGAFVPYINTYSNDKFNEKNKQYNQLRKHFLNQIITRDQKEVVEEILNSNSKLVKK